MLGSLARCGHAVVQHGLQGLPVLQGAAGQGVRVKAGILNAASHAVLVAQKAQRVRLDHRPGLGKAFLLISVQRVVPAVESFLHGFRGAGGKTGVFCPLQQGCRCDHRFERAAGNTRPPAQTRLKGGSGAGCIIGPNTLIEDSIVDEGSTVNASQVYSSHIGPHNNIGPFTHVRVNTVTDYGVHLGAYVETKNSNFARGNTVSHLTYIGDSDVGKYCNFGCGTVTCNYDGKDKFRTTIGDYCFIGCNTNLVAPVKVGDGAYTAAGSTITKDVPAQALGIARERQTNLEGWAEPKMEAYIAKKKKLEDEQSK